MPAGFEPKVVIGVVDAAHIARLLREAAERDEHTLREMRASEESDLGRLLAPVLEQRIHEFRVIARNLNAAGDASIKECWPVSLAAGVRAARPSLSRYLAAESLMEAARDG